MKKMAALFGMVLAIQGHISFARDGFDRLECGSDIRRALIGRQTANNERLVRIEARHRKLQLKGLGSGEISDELQTEFWMICGKEFVLLEDKRFRIHDVLEVPDHTDEIRESMGKCKVDGKARPETIFSLLQDKADAQLLPASHAWVINEKRRAFEPISVAGMVCSHE